MFFLRRNLTAEVFLGLGLGLSHATSLRFFGPVGIGEIFIAVAVGLLVKRVGLNLFRFSSDLDGVVKFYFFLVFLLLAPVVTGLFYLFSGHKNIQPEYIPSFALAALLSFSIVEALKKDKLQEKLVVRLFFFSFIFLVSFSFFFFPRYYAETRFVGFASDPNQLMFYVSSLMLLMAYYYSRSIALWLPCLIYVGFITGSDSFFLQAGLAVFLSILFLVFYKNRMSFVRRTIVFLCLVLICFVFIWLSYGQDLFLIMRSLWRSADNGGYRIDLIINGVKAVLYSPILGNGVGSFSGVFGPFGGSEAHSTFIDLASQFGVGIPLIIYGMFICFILKNLKWHQALVAGFAVAFVVSGIFHNNGRHFIFWFEFGLIYYFVRFKRVN